MTKKEMQEKLSSFLESGAVQISRKDAKRVVKFVASNILKFLRPINTNREDIKDNSCLVSINPKRKFGGTSRGVTQMTEGESYIADENRGRSIKK